MVTYTEKLYNDTIQNNGGQVIDLPASTFKGFRCREIDIIVKKLQSIQLVTISLKAERYTLQSSDPMHPRKKRVNCYHNFSQTFMLIGNH